MKTFFSLKQYFDNHKKTIKKSLKLAKSKQRFFSREEIQKKYVFWKFLENKIIVLLIKQKNFEIKYILAVFKKDKRKYKQIFYKSWESSTARSNMDYVIYQVRKSLDNIFAKI